MIPLSDLPKFLFTADVQRRLWIVHGLLFSNAENAASETNCWSTCWFKIVWTKFMFGLFCGSSWLHMQMGPINYKEEIAEICKEYKIVLQTYGESLDIANFWIRWALGQESCYLPCLGLSEFRFEDWNSLNIGGTVRVCKFRFLCNLVQSIWPWELLSYFWCTSQFVLERCYVSLSAVQLFARSH